MIKKSVMIAIDVYSPDQWRDFFVMVGGAAAALTCLLVFTITGAWFLLVGVYLERVGRKKFG
jgi:hypothetical protein